MRYGIDKKVISLFILSVTILGIALGFYFIRHEEEALLAELDERARTLLGSLAASSEYPVLSGITTALSNIAEGALNQKDVIFCEIRDNEGEILFQGGTKEEAHVKEYTAPILTEKIKEPAGEELILGAEEKEIEEIGEIYLVLSLANMRAKLNEASKTIAVIITLGILFTSLCITVSIRYFLGQPIKKLVMGTEMIASGDLSYNVPIRTRDEIGELAASFNKMTGDLRKYRDHLEELVEARTVELQREITERKRAEDQIKASLKEKEVLLQEVHHRVKNNLQIILSLFNLQSGYIKDKQSLDLLKESRNRIKSMALVHERLYQSKDLARVEFAEYIRGLTTDLFRSYGVDSELIKLIINVNNVYLDISTAIPCALIINELVSNSLKHAFPSGQEGEIGLDLRLDDENKFTLMVRDNGVGLPKDLDFRNTESLGLQLVVTLVDQIEGSIELDRSAGTAFKIEFGQEAGGRSQESGVRSQEAGGRSQESGGRSQEAG
ncbi:MAG: histidine kinase dimerization/phosphoacceptor domain -containing protein, partial [bacterium]|nr:histidine kinase dimerization/phosphoacceptor domain -containing protein [bacterium]